MDRPLVAFIRPQSESLDEVAAATMYMELNTLGYLVRQGGFGGSRFYEHLYKLLGVGRSRRSRKSQSKSIGDRLTEYFRSLRLGK